MPAPKAVERLDRDHKVATISAIMRGLYIAAILVGTVFAVAHILG